MGACRTLRWTHRLRKAAVSGLGCVVALTVSVGGDAAAAAPRVQPHLPGGALLAPVIIAQEGAGLRLLSAPQGIVLELGVVAFLPVEVQGAAAPLPVAARAPIHTYVNDVTAAEPAAVAAFPVGVVGSDAVALTLQTLRLYDHSLTLIVGEGDGRLEVTLPVRVRVPPRSVLFGLDPAGWVALPFVEVYGPDCRPCGTPTTESRECFMSVADLSRCRHWDVRFDPRAEQAALAAAVASQAYACQIVRDAPTTQSFVFTSPGRFVWQPLDWLFEVAKARVGGHWSASWYLLPGATWMRFCGPPCTNPDGSVGLVHPDNAYLMGEYRGFVRALARRYAGRLQLYELVNEPAAEFWLCPCTAPGGGACNATAGINQPCCPVRFDEAQGRWVGGPNSQEFVAAYGELLLRTAEVAAEEVAAADASALVITGAVDTGQHLTATTAYLIDPARGDLLRRHPNVVVGIHQYPYFDPPAWLRNSEGQLLDCSYFQPGHDWYWLPDGCETAPPLTGEFMWRGELLPVRLLWQHQDEQVDVSEMLSEVQALGLLDRFFMADTELHAGWHDHGFEHPDSPPTTPAREALAGLRIGAINAHQGVLASEFIYAPADPAVYNAMVRHLAGARPVYRWAAQRVGSDYSGCVYKLFRRGDEDIAAMWSNAAATCTFSLAVGEAARFRRVVMTRFAARGPAIDTTVQRLPVPPPTIEVAPLEEFVVLSAIGDRPGFSWLENLQATAAAGPRSTPATRAAGDATLSRQPGAGAGDAARRRTR